MDKYVRTCGNVLLFYGYLTGATAEKATVITRKITGIFPQ
jgi:hypothetical protein